MKGWEEYKIKACWGEINTGYLPVLKEYDYKEDSSTIYLTHLQDIFTLQKKLVDLGIDATMPPSIIVYDGELLIYDDWIEK